MLRIAIWLHALCLLGTGCGRDKPGGKPMEDAHPARTLAFDAARTAVHFAELTRVELRVLGMT